MLQPRRSVPTLATFLAAATLGAGSSQGLYAQDDELQGQGMGPRDGQPVALVTGSTGGLGREVALALGERGHHVIVHGRNAERGMEVVEAIQDAGEGTARFYPADLADYDEIRAFTDAVQRDYDRIDVLVNNAGIAFITDEERYENEDGYELHFQINYLSHWLITDRLLPLVQAAGRETGDARIVNVSSLSRAPLDFDNLQLEEGYSVSRAYGQSKLAQVMHAMELAPELEADGIRFNALHPATFMDTDMITEAGLDPRSSVQEGLANVLQLVEEDVGTGEYYVDGAPAEAAPQAYDADVRDRLMEVSAELTAAGGR